MKNICIKNFFKDVLIYSKYDGADKILLFELATIVSCELNVEKVDLYLDRNLEVSELTIKGIYTKIDELINGKPLAYILGFTEFRSLSLATGSGALIPRNETELMVDLAKPYIKEKSLIVDVGTGTGAIGLSVAQENPLSDVIGIDVSDAALYYAEKNKIKNSIKNASFKNNNLCSDFTKESIDVILANLPYISETEYNELSDSVKIYEPKLALTPGKTGLELIEKLIEQSTVVLKKNGVIILEIGYKQGPAIRDLFEAKACFSDVKIIKDYNFLDRFVSAIKV